MLQCPEIGSSRCSETDNFQVKCILLIIIDNDPQIQAIKLAKKFNRWQEWEIKNCQSIFVSGRNLIQFDSIWMIGNII